MAGGVGIAALVLVFIFFVQLRRVAGEITFIATRVELERLKSVIKTQMIAALILIPMAITPLLIWMWLMANHEAAPWDHLALIGYAAVFHISSIRIKAVEAGLRAIPTADPVLDAEYKSAVETWRHKALPDW